MKAIADVHGAAIHPDPHPDGGLIVDVAFPDGNRRRQAQSEPTAPTLQAPEP